MTQDEQNADLVAARTFLCGTDLSVKRCEHETCTLTALWIFNTKGEQTGSITRETEPRAGTRTMWRVTRMKHGQAIAQFYETSLEMALADPGDFS